MSDPNSSEPPPFPPPPPDKSNKPPGTDDNQAPPSVPNPLGPLSEPSGLAGSDDEPPPLAPPPLAPPPRPPTPPTDPADEPGDTAASDFDLLPPPEAGDLIADAVADDAAVDFDLAGQVANRRSVKRARKARDRANRKVRRVETKAAQVAEKKYLASLGRVERKAEKARLRKERQAAKREEAKQRKIRKQVAAESKAEASDVKLERKQAKRSSKTTKVKLTKEQKAAHKQARRIERGQNKVLKASERKESKKAKQAARLERKTSKSSKPPKKGKPSKEQRGDKAAAKKSKAKNPKPIKPQKALKEKRTRTKKVRQPKKPVALDEALGLDVAGKPPSRWRLIREIVSLSYWRDISKDRTLKETSNQVWQDRKKRRKQRQTWKATKTQNAPSSGIARVVLWDDKKLMVTSWKAGEIRSVEEQDYETVEAALEAASKLKKVRRFIIAESVQRRNAPIPSLSGDALQDRVELAAVTLNTMNVEEHSELALLLPGSGSQYRSQALLLPAAGWRSHKTIQSNRKHLVISGVSVAPVEGAWLRIGRSQIELSFIDAAKRVRRVESMNDALNTNFGLEKIEEELVAGKLTLADQADRIASWVSEQTLNYENNSGNNIRALHLYGFGARMPSLTAALSRQLSNIAIKEGFSTLPSDQFEVWKSVGGNTGAVETLSSWRAPLMTYPSAEIKVVKRHKQWQYAKAGIGVLVFVLLLGGWFTRQGSQRHQRILDFEERTAVAQQELAAIEATPPISALGGLRELQNVLGCPEAAANLTTPLTGIAAVPRNFHPDAWPTGWYETLLNWEIKEDLSVVLTNQPAVEASVASVRSLLTGRPELTDMTDIEINTAFSQAGLDPSVWRRAAWQELHFTAPDLTFSVPTKQAICTTTSRDLLTTAQNAPLTAALISRQLQSVDTPSTLGNPHWITNDTLNVGGFDGALPTITLTSEYQVLEYNDLTIFGAGLHDDVQITETLRPLALLLWGEDGVVRLTKSPERECRTGFVDDISRQVCGANVALALGHRALIQRNDWQQYVGSTITEPSTSTDDTTTLVEGSTENDGIGGTFNRPTGLDDGSARESDFVTNQEGR